MSVVKEGFIKRYSRSMFSGGWNTVYVKLYSDSNLLAYKRQGDTSAKVQIYLKNVCKHLAYGEHTLQNFQGIPALPQGATISCLLAIPKRPSHKAKAHYFLFNNEQELHDWLSAMISTNVSSQGTCQPSTAPPQYSGPPPPYYNTHVERSFMPQSHGIDHIGQASNVVYGGSKYPQQPGYYTQPVYTQQSPIQPASYLQQPYYGQQSYRCQLPPPQGYHHQPQGYVQTPPAVVYTNDHHHKKSGLGGILSGNTGKMATGLLGGAALGYGASKLLGHGLGLGGFGMGRCGSWSSLNSFGSVGSFD